jgi:hypothetical protein
MTRRNWLDTHIARTEALLTELYTERDARLDRQLDPPQVAETMRKLESSVYARRRYENKVRTDPALLEAHRKRGRENWRKQQELKKAAAQQAAVAKKLSFTLKV